MKRALTIILSVTGALILLLLVGVFGLFNTGAGKAFIKAQIESRAASTLGSTVDIGALNGAPPGLLEFKNITISDDEGPWLTIETLQLEWKPFLLLRKQVHVDHLVIDSAALLRDPPQRPEQPGENKPFSLQLPDNLPSMRVLDIGIVDFRSALSGVEARLDGGGSLVMGGKHLNTNLNLTSENSLDNVDILIDLDPDSNRLFVDALVAAAPDGVIAAFAGLRAPLSLEAGSVGPLDNASLNVAGRIGLYGEVNATLNGDIKNLTAVDIKGTFAPGERLNKIEELSKPLTFDVRLAQRPRGGALTIQQATSALGEIDGEVLWENARRQVAQLNATLNISMAEDYRADIQSVTGNKLAVVAQLKPRGKTYQLEASLAGDAWRLDLRDGVSDMKEILTGDLAVELQPNERYGFARSGAELVGRLNIDMTDRAALEDFTLALGENSTAAGRTHYSFESDEISFTGDVELTPALIQQISPSVLPSDVVSADLDLTGPIDQFKLTAKIAVPDLQINENQAPAFNADINLAGLPRRPAGDINAKANKGAGKFDAMLRSSADGAISVDALSYQGSGFNLNGKAAADATFEKFSFDINYAGDDRAEPWPGVALSGDAALEGVFARSDSSTRINFNAGDFRANGYAISNLSLTANGPPSAIKTAFSADSIVTPQVGALSNLSAGAVVDARETVNVTVQNLSGVAIDNDFSLKSPATLKFSDGVAVEDFILAWGRTGIITADAAFTRTRWLGDVDLTDVNVPGADGRITLSLDLDTNDTTPARGNFRLQSLLTQNETATISGAFRWDGQEVVITSNDDADAIDMRIILPAALTKTPTLSINTEGDIDGYARYDGRIEVIAAYLPPTLQTLEGGLTASLAFGGDTKAPEISGKASIADGAYTELQSGVSLAGLNAQADAAYSGAGSTIVFTGGAHGSEQSGGDTIKLTGNVKIGEVSSVNLELKLEGAELSAHPVTSLLADGVIKVDGPLDAVAANGDITINELNAEIITPENTGLTHIDVVSIEDLDKQSVDPYDRPTSTVDYKLNINADDRIFIRGRGLESEWSAGLNALNNKGAPLILGRMTLRRGWLDFSGRRFELTRGVIQFDRLSANDPLLDIRAEHETSDGVTAIIAVAGRATQPSIELRSTPTLPSEDIMALVLFGKPAAELTAVESLQTAQALASLGGIGPFGGSGGITGTLRQAAGLDLLNFDLDPQNGGGSLTIGKYVAEGLFVSATQDAQGKSGSVRVEYDITDNISVETEIKQDGDQTVSANWKKDF